MSYLQNAVTLYPLRQLMRRTYQPSLKQSDMTIKTERLTLRPWHDNDAEALFKYAQEPEIGQSAGWPAHKSQQESLEVIRTVFSAPETYAVVPDLTGEPVGCVGVVPPRTVTDQATPRHEAAHVQAEIGYWIGKPYWGMGFIPEAVDALIKHLHENLHTELFWIALFDGNDKSRRVAEKCGFTYHHTYNDGVCAEHFYIKTVTRATYSL